MKEVIGISRYLDLAGCEIGDLMLPDLDQHRRWIDEDGISFFNLPPYSMTQMVSPSSGKSNWFYVDTGQDGHAILGFDKARMVLLQTMKACHDAERLEVERLQSNRLKIVISDPHCPDRVRVTLGEIGREKVALFFDEVSNHFGWNICLDESNWMNQDFCDCHVYGQDTHWSDVVDLTKWIINWLQENKS